MWSEEKLNELLTTPAPALIEDVQKIEGDILILGAGGKMGPSMCVLAKNAIKAAGLDKKVIAVSRFSDPISLNYLRENDIDIISCDLTDVADIKTLPFVKNIIYLAGKKFGTTGNEWQTWGMNAVVPSYVIEHFKGANIVVFSSGNIYPLTDIETGGCTEEIKPIPVGEYAMSCLARERVFEFGTMSGDIKTFMYRLNFAVDLRYGVLFDIANKIVKHQPIQLGNACFNIIWQGKANEIAIRGLLHCSAPSTIMNVTGKEIISVKEAAEKLGKLLNIEPIFEGEPQKNAYLNNAAKSFEVFGESDVTADTLIEWQAQWILDGCRTIDKPTHFETRGGSY